MRDAPKTGSYTPNPVGPVFLTTHSSTRSRLNAGGTYFRSVEYGQAANLIQVAAIEDTSVSEAICVVLHTVLAAESVIGTGITPELTLFKLAIDWFAQVKIAFDVATSSWRATLQGIRWQVAPGPAPYPDQDLGPVKDGLFSAAGVTFKITGLASWPTSATVVLRPRTHRFTLVPLAYTDPATSVVSTGYDIEALRGALNGDATCYVTMPTRGTAGDPLHVPPIGATTGSDAQDGGMDAPVLTPFDFTNLTGGDGLPAAPVGLNTGPYRVLVHLNYSELADGSMGLLNEVFEWAGDSAVVGTWVRYA